jgi:hypothetical protein
MGTEATLIYNLGPLSWLINNVRRALGIAWGISGRAIYHTLDFLQSQVLRPRPNLAYSESIL